jgi:hypothetical protein
MISSITVIFLVTCYLYFKQYYKKLIDAQIEDTDQATLWNAKVKKKLIVFPLGAVIIVVLYITSFTIIRLMPDLENVKLYRRIADIAATGICVFLFYLDKRELDTKLVVKVPELF